MHNVRPQLTDYIHIYAHMCLCLCICWTLYMGLTESNVFIFQERNRVENYKLSRGPHHTWIWCFGPSNFDNFKRPQTRYFDSFFFNKCWLYFSESERHTNKFSSHKHSIPQTDFMHNFIVKMRNYRSFTVHAVVIFSAPAQNTHNRFSSLCSLACFCLKYVRVFLPFRWLFFSLPNAL